MKATGLRIGNIIECYLGAPISESIESVVCADTFINFDKYPKTTYHPIPLTEEWLVKFGFTMRNNGFNKDKPSFSTLPVYSIGEHGFWVYYDIKCNSVKGATIDYLYVHQLQNLYFALTGEELTIK